MKKDWQRGPLMQNKIGLFAAVLACLWAFSGCSGFSSSTADLMRPPRLTPEQSAINDALAASALTQTYTLKYPKSGDYRSAFVFHDIDGDGAEESIAFYEPDINDTARIVLLDREGDVWKASCDLAGAGQDVEFIAFADLTASGSSDIVVGWSASDGSDKQLSIYTYENGVLVNGLKGGGSSTEYDAYLIGDLSGNGRDDIIFTGSSVSGARDAYWVKMICFDGNDIVISDRTALSDRIDTFAGITAGRISASSSKRGVFIDEVLANGMLATEVFTVNTFNRFEPVISSAAEAEAAALAAPAESPDGDIYEPDYKTPTLFERTFRANTAYGAGGADDAAAEPLCGDVDSDRIIEIPTVSVLPGYESEDQSETLYLIEYNHLAGDTLQRAFAAAVNRSGGYRVRFPEEWIGAVTIVNQMESNEWRFIGYNGGENPLNDLSVELARIRVVSQKDYQDKFLENYRKFSQTRGMFQYYGYVPPAASGPLSVTWEQLQEMFSLL